MTDPYNSPGPYAPPSAQLETAVAPRAKPDTISRLDVSESWKRKFRLINKAGGPGLPAFRDLAFSERFGLNFNFIAFIFGPFYYLTKGLWRQAIVYLICAVALGLLFEMMGLGKFSRAIGYGFAAVYATRANVSYYRKVVLREAPWL